MNPRVRADELTTKSVGSHDDGPDDEISLADLVRTLWRGRALILLLPAIAMALAVLAIMATSLSVNRPVTYYVELKGIENGRYPNGTAFSPRDLVVPEVVAELRSRYDIPQDVDLRDAVTVTFDNPIAASLTQAYRERLSGRNLSQVEIAAINEEYQRELRSAVQAMLRIEVNHQALGLDAATGGVIARAIPEIWSQVFSEDFRILTDTRIAQMSVSGSDEDLESAASILVAKQRLGDMSRGLQIMTADNRLSLLKTSEGYSVEDMMQELRQFGTVHFNTIMSLGFEAGDDVASAYITDLRLELADLRRQMASYEQTFRELREFQTAGNAPGAPGAMPSEATSIQLSDSGLAEVLELAQRASFAGFIQDMLRQRQEVAMRISEVERDIETAALEGRTLVTEGFRQRAAQLLQDLTGRYGELVEAAHARMRAQVGDLYTPVTAPMILGSLFSMRMLLGVVLAGGLGGLLAIVIVLLRSSMREGARNRASS